MRKLLFAGLAVTALAIAPSALAASDDDVDASNKDVDECAASGTTAEANLDALNGGESDRGSVCVAAEGTVHFHIGGEAQSEQNPGQGGACGAIAVGGQTLTGDPNWDSDPDTSDSNPGSCQ